MGTMAEFLGRNGPSLPRRHGHVHLRRDRFVSRAPEPTERGGGLGVLFVDLDDFKALNHRDGHEVGEAIYDLAHRLDGPGVRSGGDGFLPSVPEHDPAGAPGTLAGVGTTWQGGLWDQTGAPARRGPAGAVGR